MPVLDKIQKPFSGQNSKAVLWTKFKVLSPGQNSKAVLWTKFKVRSPILQNLQNRARNGVQNRSFPIVNVLKSTKNRPKNFNPLSYPIGGGIGGPFVSIKIRFSKNDFLILPTFPIVNVLKWVFLVPNVIPDRSSDKPCAGIHGNSNQRYIICWSHGHY